MRAEGVCFDIVVTYRAESEGTISKPEMEAANLEVDNTGTLLMLCFSEVL